MPARPRRAERAGSIANRTSSPSDRPIQLRCIRRTFSGQRSSPSSASQQFLGIVGDLEEPLRQFALLDDRAGAPAAAVDDLLVGEHGVVDRIPVDLRFLARDQPGGEEIQEQLLLMPVIGGIAGGDLARPVERQAHRLELRAHRRRYWRRSISAGCVLFCIAAFSAGMPNASQPIGCRTLKPLRALVARHDVAHRVVAHMPHVDAPGRIGEHLEHVIVRPRIDALGREHLAVGPDFLPFRARIRGRCSARAASGRGLVLVDVRKAAGTKHDLALRVKSPAAQIGKPFRSSTGVRLLRQFSTFAGPMRGDGAFMSSHIREPVLHATPIVDLRPTQITVGMREVRAEAKGLARARPGGLRAVSRRPHGARRRRARRRTLPHRPPSPGARASRGGRAERVRDRSSPTSASSTPTTFWNLMDFHGWTHPFDAKGRRRDYADLPKSIDGHEGRPLSLACGRIAQHRRLRQGFHALFGIRLGGFPATAHQAEGARERFRRGAGKSRSTWRNRTTPTICPAGARRAPRRTRLTGEAERARH